MIAWFVGQLERFVALGVALAAALIAGVIRAPFLAAARAVTPVVVRRGTAEDVIELRHRVLRAGRPRHTAVFAGDDDVETHHWVALQAGRVVGVVTILAPNPERQLRGMAVEPALQRSGIGSKLLAAIQDSAPMWCNARAGVVAFYREHGWEPQGESFEVDDVGPHQRMVYAPRR